MKINSIRPQSNSYTQILSHIAKTPNTLYYRGTLPTERRPSVAIIGTRKPTQYGREVTNRFTEELARQGIVIVSGLALGVDGIAHQAALDAGGTTLAILANGLSYTYPRTHASLGEKIIAQGGALLSEYEPSTTARPHHFLERNRIVSGLSDAIIITEASARSGTMNTATHALEQGKEVYVVPGPITSPMSQGCNQLIRQGATPLLEASQILELLLPSADDTQTRLPLGSNELETAIIKLISSGLRDGDEMLSELKCDATEFSTSLTMLEINGAIRSLGANQWTLR